MKDTIARIRGGIFSLQCRFFRKGIRVGKGLRMHTRLDIRGSGSLTIGDNCIVAGIKGDKTQFVTLYTLDRSAEIEIGDNARLYAARISSRYRIKLGGDVHIEESGIMDTDFHSIDQQRGDPKYESREKCEVFIGNRVMIGARSLVTKGVRIGDGAVIVPGSVVSRSLPTFCLACGNPAKAVDIQTATHINPGRPANPHEIA